MQAALVREKGLDVGNASNALTQFADINGRRLAYRSIGSGRPFILCQRFRGNLDDWDPAFLDALALDFRVIIFDYSAFGLSTGNPSSDMKSFANDVRDLASFLGISKCIVGGWSFGGAVAQIVTTEMPELVSQTIVIGTRPPGPFNHDLEEIFLQVSSKPVNDFDDELILFFEPTSEISRALAKKSHDRIAARTTDQDEYIRPEFWQHYRFGFMDYAADPYGAREKLAAGKVPLLVISADHEVCFPPENWFELNRKMRSMQVIVIAQTGHGPHHQYPQLVSDYIKAFITNNEREGLVNR